MGGNAQIAYDWMIDRGYSPNIAAAFVGNMIQESYDDIDPTAHLMVVLLVSVNGMTVKML